MVGVVMQRVILLFLCLNLLGVSSLTQAETGTTTPPVILVFGDSLSAAHGIAVADGWVALLSSRLKTQAYPHQVINESISGETSSGGLARFPKALATHKPKLVILELGANDGLRALNLQEMRNNLSKMIELSQQAGAKVLLLGMKIPPNYGKAYTEEFYQSFQQLAIKYQLSVVPFFLEGVAGNPSLVLSDGIHPTASAQGQLLDTVWEKLSNLLEKVSLTH
jgi:acyl-CoA thioesterase-1